METGLLVCRLNVLKNINKRTGILAAIEACFIVCMLQPFVDIAKSEGFSLTPFGFPIMQSENIAHLVLLSSAILFLANCPFDDALTFDIIAKCGYKNFFLGNILFIGMFSGIYILFVQFIALLCILPVIDFSFSWGTGWYNYLDINILIRYHTVFPVEPYILYNFSAAEALLLSSLLEWYLVTFLGLLSYCLNRLTHRSLGLLAMVIFALLDLTIYNMYPFFWYFVSPVSLAMLTTYQYSSFSGNVTLAYGQFFFPITIGLLILGCFYIECILTKKKGVVLCVKY